MLTDADEDRPPTPSGAAGAAAVLVDVVDTWEEARALELPPLVVREGLRQALDCGDGPEIDRIDAGHSNPTFLVRCGSSRWILRRPPRPPFAPKAHDVLREHRFLAALRDEPVRAPRPVLACEDASLIGAPFYLMEALDGLILRDRLLSPLDAPAECARIADELVDALVELHAVDVAAVDLGDRRRGSAYLERQLALWGGQWDADRTRDVPAIDEVGRRLRASMPSSPPATIVHGDYKLDNVIFAAGAPARLAAILDWEMATIGDPLADVGFLTATWVQRGESPERLSGLSAVTREPGFPSRRQLAERYAERSGRPLDDLAWYQALALWKLAILLEASYRRFLAGTTADEFFRSLEEGIPRIADQALYATTGALL